MSLQRARKGVSAVGGSLAGLLRRVNIRGRDLNVARHVIVVTKVLVVTFITSCFYEGVMIPAVGGLATEARTA